MTKISRILAGASAVAMLGVAAVPMATFADPALTSTSTVVEVKVNTECLIGDGTGTTGTPTDSYTEGGGTTSYDNDEYIGVSKLSVTLSATTPAAETSGTVTSGDEAKYIGTVCNAANGYKLTEKMDHTDLKDGAVTGFTAGATTDSAATFTGNHWSIKYADKVGTTVQTGADTFARTGKAISDSAEVEIAKTSGPTTLSTISQKFGAKTDGSVLQGVYTATATYTITPN